MDFPDLMDHAGVKEDSLCQSRLSGINVRTDPDVPRPLKRIRSIRRVRIRHSFGPF
jgi:hypothetical protein